MAHMLHHVSLPVGDLHASAKLYDAALAGLGYRRVSGAVGFIGYGTEDGRDKFALVAVRTVSSPGAGFHLAFSATSIGSVDCFYQAALENGAADNGQPGLRPDYGASYYAAYIVDLDGHHIEAVCND